MIPIRSRLFIFICITFCALVPAVFAIYPFHEIQEKSRLKKLQSFRGPPLPPDDGGQPCYVLDTTSPHNDNTAIKPQALVSMNDTQPVQNATFVPPRLYNGTVILDIDHFGESPPPYTFANRFWVIDDYYKPGGPVFVFDTGEANDAYLYYAELTDPLSFFRKYVQEFGGLGILWEHRYYGHSTPYVINEDTTGSQMKYLTTEQALEDFVVFAKNFKWKIGGPNAEKTEGGGLTGIFVDFNPQDSPWVFVGGSYPGIRATLLRDRYPDVVFAAYASSAPVEASLNLSIYWEQVYRGMVEYGEEDCAHRIKHTLDYIDSQLSANDDTAAHIKQLFLGRTAEINSNEDFAYIFAYPLWGWQNDGLSGDLARLCEVLVSGENNSTTVLDSGEELANAWANWDRFTTLVNNVQAYTTNNGWCEGPIQGLREPNCKLGGRSIYPSTISWLWQTCTEWGFYQATNVGPHALGSKFNTLEFQQSACYVQFPDAHLHPPNTTATNAKFGGWKLRPSNTFWTEGEFDPWRPQSLLSNEAYSEQYQTTTKIPKCGQKQELSEPLFGYLLENAQHCYDFFFTETASIPQNLFAQALSEWLTCFPY